MYKLPLHLILLITLSGMTPCAQAEDIAKAAVAAGIDAAFSETERQLIHKYFGGTVVHADAAQVDTAKPRSRKGKGSKDLPPGLAKRDRLPPGLEMQLQRNGTLPPGLAKRGLPSDLDRQLRPVPAGYERVILADAAAVVLVHTATGVITDIVKDLVIGD